MNVKIDTKEKFTVLTPEEQHISANMTEELQNLLLSYTSKDNPHIILNLKNVKAIDIQAAETIAVLQQQFYEKSFSFIVCEMQTEVEEIFEKAELLEELNTTPTESEAWDIVQMEEIEREFMDGFDE
ncbi:MAG: STAS domain-containing protein [Bacteroidetes bacterium]|nr:STAS domain-containing protein [Bacteroidota bacterium]MBS1757125.1 STAS domain-containing protein [Bacteroidota bacterium]